MASISQVIAALQTAVSNALIAGGITNQGTVIGGWPNMPALTKQMEQVPPQYCVSVYPLDSEKLTTRFFPHWQYLTGLNVTLTASVSGNAITFGGTAASGFVVNVVVNAGLQGQAVVYQTTSTDTLASIATSVASRLSALSGISAVASGDTVTVTGASSITCNVGGSATIAQEVRRTERQFQISTWCPDGPTRSAIVNAIDTYCATLYFLTLGDGTFGRLKYVRGPWNDEMQRDTLYFAHQIFSVEFATMQTETATQVGITQSSMQATLANGQSVPVVTDTEG